MTSPIIVLGSGGHAKVVLDVLRLLGREIVGLTTEDHALIGREAFGCRVLGSDAALAAYAPEQIRLVNAIGSVHAMEARKSLFEKMKARGFAFAQVIHPSAVIAGDAVIGEGAQVMAGAVIQPGARIGDNTIVNTRASVDHDCSIGAHVHIAPGCTLSGNVRVADDSHIGAGATIIQGRQIGAHCLVAAGAVVIHDVADNERVAGVPARRMRDRV